MDIRHGMNEGNMLLVVFRVFEKVNHVTYGILVGII